MNRKTISKLAEYSTIATSLLLAIFLIFEIKIGRIPLILFFISTIADIIINRRWQYTKWDKSKLVFIAMIAYYLLAWIWHPFETNEIDLFKQEVENRLPFIAFGIIGLIGWISPKLKPQYFTIVMIITSLCCTVWSWHEIATSIGMPQSFGEYQQAFTLHRVNSHMLFNIYLNTTILFSIYSILHTTKTLSKIAYSIAIITLYIIVLTSEGRTGFFTTNVLFFGFITYLIFKWKRWAIIPYAAIAIVGFCFILMSHSKVKNSHNDPRIYIWINSLNTIKEQPILGYGINDARIAFIEKGITDEKFVSNYLNKIPKERRYDAHPHNVFLNAMMEFGIIGLTLLLFIYIYPIFILKGKRWVYTLGFITIIGMQSMFEIYTSWGVPQMLFCFLFTYWYCTPTFKNKKELEVENRELEIGR